MIVNKHWRNGANSENFRLKQLQQIFIKSEHPVHLQQRAGNSRKLDHIDECAAKSVLNIVTIGWLTIFGQPVHSIADSCSHTDSDDCEAGSTFEVDRETRSHGGCKKQFQATSVLASLFRMAATHRIINHY
jgi:hypothetical protein